MAQAVYQLDPSHTSAHFSVRHMMISTVRGEFSKISGTVLFDPANLAASKIEVQIDAASLNTRDPQRDAHLRSPDFFDVEKYPLITFHSTRVAPGDGGGTLQGDLTIHGVTRPVTLEVEDLTPETRDPWGNVRIGATATGKINRKDFGLVWNTTLETGGVLVGDEVKLTIDLEAVRQAAAKADSAA